MSSSCRRSLFRIFPGIPLPITRTVSGGFLFPDRNPDRRPLPLAAGSKTSNDFRKPLPCHGSTPVKPVYRAGAERNARRFLFYTTCLTVECLLLGHDIGVVDAGKKLPIFFQTRLDMMLR